MTLWEYLSTDENTDVPSEEILNVLRETDDPVMGTQEIADEIGMSRQGTQNRLEDLEDDDRIESKKIGDTIWVWGLHPEERRKPIPPEIDRMVRLFDCFRDMMQPTKFLGGVILSVGFALLYMGVTGVLVNVQNPIVGNDYLTVMGWGAVLIGALTWLVGGWVIYGTVVVERFASWRITKNRFPERASETSRNSESRGQVPIRLILGGFVLLFVADPLFDAGLQIQADLASLKAISAIEAFIISALLIGSIVAAILSSGGGR